MMVTIDSSWQATDAFMVQVSLGGLHGYTNTWSSDTSRNSDNSGELLDLTLNHIQ